MRTVVFAAWLGACAAQPAGDKVASEGEEGETEASGEVEVSGTPANAVDILIVMDDSSTMGYSSYGFREHASEFVAALETYSLAVNIGVTTADNGSDPLVASPANGAFVGPVIVGDPEAGLDLGELYEQLDVGIDGSGIEAGLETGLTALTDHARLADQIAEFRREGAPLSVIFVTNEEDKSSEPVATYLRNYLALGEARQRVRLSAAVTREQADGTYPEYCTVGTRLEDVAAQTGGYAADLFASDFGAEMEALAAASASIPATPDTCSVASDCPVDHHCDDGTCLPGCAADSDCLGGETCESETCQPGACRTGPLDCGLGEMCDQTSGECSDGGGCETCDGPDAECGAGECVNFGDDAAPAWYCLLDCETAGAPDACPRGFDCRDLSGAGDLYCYGECPVLAPLLP